MAKVVRWAAFQGRREGFKARLLPNLGKGAKRLKPGCCLTLLSVATRKALGKRQMAKVVRWAQGRRGAFKARLLLNVAF